MSTLSNLSKYTSKMASSTAKISSGSSITKAADNPAGLAISEKMKANITINNQAVNNNYDSINYSNITEGKLSGVSDSLIRMSELASQASNGTYSDTERSALNAEFSQLSEQINAQGFSFNESFDISTLDGANAAVEGLSNVINDVSTQRGAIGAAQNGAEHAINADEIYSENMTNSLSEISDVDVATEMMEYTKNAILQNSSIAMLLHEKQNAQQVVQLLQ